MSAQPSAPAKCPRCGFIPSNDELPQNLFRPWHIMHGRAGVKSYVASLGEEAHEWLLALYVDREMQLLAVDTLARGDIGRCPVPFNRIIGRAFQIGAAAYILVHNHPSGDERPSNADMRATVRLAKLSADLEIPMLDHLIVAGDEIVSCGHF